MKLGFILTILVCVLAGNVPAQDLKQTLLNMQQVYAKAEKLHIIMEVKVFESRSDTEPLFYEKADIKKQKNNYRYQFASTEMLLNERYQVVVDKESKDIMLSKRDHKKEVQYQDMFKTSMDSLLSFYDTPMIIDDSTSVTHYRVFQKVGVVDQFDLYVDLKTSTLKQMQYHYRDGQFVSIVFEVFDTAPTFEQNVFNEQDYIVVASGRVKPSTRLQYYSIFGEAL